MNPSPANVLPPLVPTTSVAESFWAACNEAVLQDLLRRPSELQPYPTEAVLEMKKFLFLAGTYGPGISMTSRQVDAAWHAFILRTADYANFCHTHFNRFVHHVPKGPDAESGDAGRRHFESLYVRQFGVLPPIWGPALNVREETGADDDDACSDCDAGRSDDEERCADTYCGESYDH